MPPRRSSDGVFRYNLKAEGIKAKAVKLNGTVAAFRRNIQEANKQAVLQMAKWAVEELDQHISRPANKRSTRPLHRALLEDDTHFWNADGFQFMRTSKMDKKVVNRDRPGAGTYWRAIEHGLSEGFVGRRVPLEFIDAKSYVIKPDPERGQQNERTAKGDFFVGGSDRARKSRAPTHQQAGKYRGQKVRAGGYVHQGYIYRRTRHNLSRRAYIVVKNPIQPYHYAQSAVSQFLADDKRFYKSLLDQQAAQLREAGITLRFEGV